MIEGTTGCQKCFWMGASHKFDEHQCLDLINNTKRVNKMSGKFSQEKKDKLIYDIQFFRGYISGIQSCILDDNICAGLDHLESLLIAINDQVLEALSYVD